MQIGFSGILFLIFLALKLTDHIDWSWWWVTAPLWIAVLVSILLFAIFAPLVTRLQERNMTTLDKWVHRMDRR